MPKKKGTKKATGAWFNLHNIKLCLARKTYNNFLFLKVLNRTVEKEYKDYYNWSWDFGKDKDKFKKYFDVFAADESQVSIKDAYENFKRAHSGTPVQ